MAPPTTPLEDRCPLSDLAGVWVGNGLNVMSLPDKEHGKFFRVQINATREVLSFTPVESEIANRGSAQNDLLFFGMQYLQLINDRETNQPLHLEPGLWLHTPETIEPSRPQSVVRLATVPHGNSLLASGAAMTTRVPPTIPPVSTKPTGANVSDAYLEPFARAPLPAGLPAAAVFDPNVILRDALEQVQIVETTALEISTARDGGILNIPFVATNANATRMTATFWIESVRESRGREVLQLQYSQVVLLEFGGVVWPHVSVATLTKRM